MCPSGPRQSLSCTFLPKPQPLEWVSASPAFQVSGASSGLMASGRGPSSCAPHVGAELWVEGHVHLLPRGPPRASAHLTFPAAPGAPTAFAIRGARLHQTRPPPSANLEVPRVPGDPLYPPGAPRGDTLTRHAAGASGVPGNGCRRQSSLDTGRSVLRSPPSGVRGGDGQLLFLTSPLGDCSVLAGTALPRSWAPSRGRPITCVTPPPLWNISWFSVFRFGEREAMTLLVGG